MTSDLHVTGRLCGNARGRAAALSQVLEDGGPFPDLILIDGGKDNSRPATTHSSRFGLGNLVAVGIAKKEELLFTRDQQDPIALPDNDPALLLIERIRDEAHRFAVTFHRKARTMRDLRSQLDEVPGIGPRRRRAYSRNSAASRASAVPLARELDAVVGPELAAAVIDYFAKSACIAERWTICAPPPSAGYRSSAQRFRKPSWSSCAKISRHSSSAR